MKVAIAALKSIYKEGYRYQKTGIILSGLKDANTYNANLFSTINNDEKRIKLMQAIDYTNIKYGRNALSVVQAGLKKRWNIKKIDEVQLYEKMVEGELTRGLAKQPKKIVDR